MLRILVLAAHNLGFRRQSPWHLGGPWRPWHQKVNAPQPTNIIKQADWSLCSCGSGCVSIYLKYIWNIDHCHAGSVGFPVIHDDAWKRVELGWASSKCSKAPMKDLAMIIGCKEILTVGTNDLRLTLLQFLLVQNGSYPFISSICGHGCCEKKHISNKKHRIWGHSP